MKVPSLMYEEPFHLKTWLPVSECLDRIENNIRINFIGAKWKNFYELQSVGVDREKYTFEIIVSYKGVSPAKAKAVGSITASNNQTVIKGVTCNAGWQNIYILPPLVFTAIMLLCALMTLQWQMIVFTVMFCVMLAMVYAKYSERFSIVLRDAINDAFYDAKL